MRILLSCVNTAVSLIGYDLEKQQPFWYCPANILRSCGICVHQQKLWLATDGIFRSLDASGIAEFTLLGSHENYAHRIKPLGRDLLGVVDTGNSRIHALTAEGVGFTFSPLDGWETIPEDAIHLNDVLP